MTTFLLGAAGALTALGLLGLGAAGGWQARKIMERNRCMPRRGAGGLAEEQKAFRQLQNYSAERAYGMVEEDDR